MKFPWRKDDQWISDQYIGTVPWGDGEVLTLGDNRYNFGRTIFSSRRVKR